ncbi:methyl-accepting chemotaxis protein [Sneathiella limimaris]|uniref:methyl-accepting chemotaxis protein n=1 Tax=Sneathiella limimaris TaxID=1964213 RepID=UPI00146E71E0|nr:methyl-accepting chemotaxis protein [Sneathiella limimaris]
MTDMTFNSGGLPNSATQKKISFSNMSIKMRIYSGFALAGILLIVASIINIATSSADTLTMILVDLVIELAIVAGIAVFTASSIEKILRNLADASITSMTTGQSVHIPYTNTPGALGQFAREMSTLSDNTIANMRTKAALDSCRTNVMVADENHNITYVNDTMLEMLRENEGALKSDLPQFNANGIIGVNIDDFHKNPAHQRGLLDGLRQPLETSITIGGRNFELIASPVFNSQHDRIGTVVEWEDVTEKMAKQAAEEKQAAENARIKSALDNCRTNVMVADADYNIVYANDTMMKMLQENEKNMQQDLPKFDAAKLIGTNIDSFHKNPSHQRNILGNMSEPVETSLEIGGKNYDLVVSPVLDEAGNRTGTVVEWEDVTEELARVREERRVANENSRIKSALDNCTTNMMVSDADYNIVYINDTMRDMLIGNEDAMKKDLPSFDASKIIGTNIDSFHKNPSHQRGMLDKLTSSFETSITIGGRFYDLIASPVMDDEGERIGTVVEWADVTAERNIEEEINTVVSAAVSGDFESRLTLDGKDGFMLNLSKSINSLSETVSSAMEDVGVALSALSTGDLTRRITTDYDGLFDTLKTNVNNTCEQLTEIVGDIVISASEVNNAAQEINEGTIDLSQRTEQQASNLEETAAAMEEMASTTKQNAENAQQANQLSISARDVAEKGGNVVGEVVTAMNRIETSSQKISDIIGVIDEIAFQTNLLALNAAVEAARAGDAGKGFAVVAAEVGTLAQRSSQAAKDIKGLINDSGAQVKDGVRLVGDAGESLTEIVDSIKRLSDIVSEIAAASDEQSTSISEINKSVAQMDEMTQQNSALVEENAAASRTLQDQSEAMKDRISFFTVDDSHSFQSKPSAAETATEYKAPKPNGKSDPAAHRPMPVASMSSNAAAAEDWSEF